MRSRRTNRIRLPNTASDDELAPAKIDKPKIAGILPFSAGSDIYSQARIVETKKLS